MKKNKTGFTLIEMIVVLGIIGILVTLTVISLGSIKQNTKDVKRIADIKEIQSALELYRVNEGGYPSSLTTNQALTATSATYMTLVPSNPTFDSSDACPGTDYTYTKTGSSYTIDFCLAKPAGNLSAGPKCATPQGILDRECFLCGDKIYITNITGHTCNESAPYYDKCSYDTVKIGNQCWTKQNMNIGTRINSTDGGGGNDGNMTDNTSIEKYCYADDYNNCLISGGLYQWDEAMQYSTIESSQGICPFGWHIPSKLEQETLVSYVSANGYPGSEGVALKASSSWNGTDNFGFSVVPSGLRRTDKSFDGQTVYAIPWSSTAIGSNAWYQFFYTFSGVVQINNEDHNNGLSIRCVKN